jgi:AcrR family transcriptional regulator
MSRTGSGGATASAGRPRNEQATAAILRAASELADEVGFDKLSIEGIAARAGVAKTTIYRRWSTVWAIVMDAFLADVNRLAPIQERPTARESFVASMRLLAKAYRSPQARVLRPLLGRAQVEPDLLDAVRKRWVEPRRRVAREIIRRGIAQGELRADVDTDVVLDLLYGALYHRLLVPYSDAPISEAYITAVVDTAFAGLERQRERREDNTRRGRRSRRPKAQSETRV